MLSTLVLVAASDVAFGIVFGLFAAALLVLAIVTLTWAVRRDRPGREAWRQRMIERRVGGSGLSGGRGVPSPGDDEDGSGR